MLAGYGRKPQMGLREDKTMRFIISLFFVALVNFSVRCDPIANGRDKEGDYLYALMSTNVTKIIIGSTHPINESKKNAVGEIVADVSGFRPYVIVENLTNIQAIVSALSPIRDEMTCSTADGTLGSQLFIDGKDQLVAHSFITYDRRMVYIYLCTNSSIEYVGNDYRLVTEYKSFLMGTKMFQMNRIDYVRRIYDLMHKNAKDELLEHLELLKGDTGKFEKILNRWETIQRKSSGERVVTLKNNTNETTRHTTLDKESFSPSSRSR